MRTESSARRRCVRGVQGVASLLMMIAIAACGQLEEGGPSTQAADSELASHTRATADSGKSTSDGRFAAADEKDPAPPVDMPPAEDIVLTPMEWAQDPEGNARLSVRFSGEEALPDTFGIEIDQRKSLFKRDEKDPRRFEGMVWFDFERFLDEQTQRAELLAQHKEPVAPRFDGRSMIGETRLDVLDPSVVSLARQNGSALRIPREMTSMPGQHLDASRVLTVNDLGVVEDPARTYDICGASTVGPPNPMGRGNPDGAWSFKTLMPRMANTPRPGVTPEEFVEQWLKQWTVFHEINGHPVRARTAMNARVLETWPRIAGRLDLNRAPFRLLAIVNRLDLRSNPMFGNGNGGELRFVFGVVDRRVGGGCSTMPFTVILEYGVARRGCSAVKDYAGQWIALNNAVPGSPEYNAALQVITDRVTAENGVPNKPNGSALNQIRTNEIALNSPWELRQFQLLPGQPLLRQVSNDRTPHEDYDRSGVLASFMDRYRAEILADRHTILSSYSPRLFQIERLLAGSTFTHDLTDDRVWTAPAGWPVDAEVRHKLSLATCNGCHGGEARDNEHGDRTRFVHIDVRDAGRESVLSKFLTGEGAPWAPSTFLKPDPAKLGPSHRLGDLLRRRQDLADFAAGSCAASGMLDGFYVGQLRFTH